jgi:site-specific DNA-methyltransferase (adenine-specific)
MIAALRTGRNSIGVEIDPEYCRMAARYLKAENPDLFTSSKLIFEKATTERTCLIREDHELYQVRPAKKKLDS